MRAPNFRSVGPTVQPAERKQTQTQTANAGGKNDCINTNKDLF